MHSSGVHFCQQSYMQGTLVTVTAPVKTRTCLQISLQKEPKDWAQQYHNILVVILL